MALGLTITEQRVYEYKGKYNVSDLITREHIYLNTYHQISAVNGNKNGLELCVKVYENEQKENLLTVKKYTFTPSVAVGSTNFIQQGYEYLKTLPEYADAVDC